jgi:thiamine-monophosphate kinase
MDSMPADEFDIIRRLFAPLAKSAGARGLIDDAALLESSGALVVTTDAMVQGVHFLPADPLGAVAKKALRANLSDLAAKGARPIAITLTLIWPDARPAADIETFAHGLGEDLKHYGVDLLGGDTTSTPGPLCVSVTAFGHPLGARTPSRADAQAGEDVWVTGTIGDAWLGFEALSGQWPDASEPHRAHAIAAYRTPEPPIAFAAAIAGFASASMDVSDGLHGDADKLARASCVTLNIDADAIPLSEAAHAWQAGQGAQTHGRLFDWGDDYQILFTAAPEHRAALVEAAGGVNVRLTRIGIVEAGEGARLRGAKPGGPTGHRHRLGR